MLVRESAPQVGQLILSRLSKLRVVNYKLKEAKKEAARARPPLPRSSALLEAEAGLEIDRS
jgi:hypothetical protein